MAAVMHYRQDSLEVRIHNSYLQIFILTLHRCLTWTEVIVRWSRSTSMNSAGVSKHTV